MDDRTLGRYADAVVAEALRIGPGEVLAVHGEPAHRPFLNALTEAGYRAGASYVDVMTVDPRTRHARAALAAEATLEEQPRWHDTRMRDLLGGTAGLVLVHGPEEPDLMRDVPPARAAREGTSVLPGRDRYLRAVARSGVRFCVCSWATPAWAVSVYPDLGADAAVAALEADLVRFARIADDDADDAWAGHVAHLEQVASRLTGRDLRGLHLRGPGTDLRLGLAPGTVWHGGTLEGPRGRFSPNVPTEEVFTSPVPAASEGTFACTRPLQLAGREIEGLRGELRRGRLVRLEADADDDAEFLRTYLERDRGGLRLGEIALVDGSGRVGAAGRTYRTTLLDENAASHIAFGQGFEMARSQSGSPVNRSKVHVDVMIGAPELEVTGLDADGREVPVLGGGAFA